MIIVFYALLVFLFFFASDQYVNVAYYSVVDQSECVSGYFKRLNSIIAIN
eukprot:m.5439 g.5439  ORF g.5439 m.5439 type:complete len:50 (-) comp4248_c0_seq1:117-266(-)